MTNAKNSTFKNETELHEGLPATIITIVAGSIFFVGLISNLALLCLVLKKLVSGKRSDKLFLLNILAANLFSLFGSLVGEVLGRGNIVPSAQAYCIFYHQVSFISLFNNLTSMAALCYNLYENIIKFPGNRLISFSVSLKIVAVSWALSLMLVPAAQSGFIITDKQGVGICTRIAAKTATLEETASFIALIVLVTIWMSVFCIVIRISLTGVYSKLKQHRAQTERVLYNISAVKVISFNRQAYIMVFCYSVCWIPFGVSALLVALDVISFHSPVYFACLVVAYASVASTPLIYFTVDKRFRITCCKRRNTPPRQVINVN